MKTDYEFPIRQIIFLTLSIAAVLLSYSVGRDDGYRQAGMQVLHKELMRNNQAFYVEDLGFCVYTNDRAYDGYSISEAHEQCHALVYDDYEHFCTDKDKYEVKG
jgi:hypothetical protein